MYRKQTTARRTTTKAYKPRKVATKRPATRTCKSTTRKKPVRSTTYTRRYY